MSALNTTSAMERALENVALWGAVKNGRVCGSLSKMPNKERKDLSAILAMPENGKMNGIVPAGKTVRGFVT